MRRTLLVTLLLSLVPCGIATAQTAPDDTVAIDDEGQGDVVADTTPIDPTATTTTVAAESPSATTIPKDCPRAELPQAVFVGVLAAVDSDTARFNVQETKYGTLDGFQANGQVDVEYGREVRFLTLGAAYWVTARYNPDTGRIESKAKPDARLFGGNEVLGVDDSSIQCPAIVDPFVTTHLDGTSIDTGVLTPFVNAKGHAIERILRSVALGLGALAFLVFAKRIVVWFIREGQYLVRRWRRARREATRAPPTSEAPAAP